MRDFAAKQNAPADTFPAAYPPHGNHGEGDHSALPNGGGEILDAETAEAGMQKMSELYNETGRELYMSAGNRDHD